LNAVASGTVREDGRVSTSGGRRDDSSNRALRAFVAFDLSGLSGTDFSGAARPERLLDRRPSFSDLDSLVVGRCEWGSSIDEGDYDRSAAATLATVHDEGGLDDSLDVTGRVSDRLDEGQRSFRIRLRLNRFRR